ncbi:hypothetical protein [Salinimicrobium soli]|uniref:hypothetical protein n=1 Tax=Salinimicrobium soli TaxID=1254399 RepID=UPI003AAD6C41
MDRIITSLLFILFAGVVHSQCDLTSNYEEVFDLKKEQYGDRTMMVPSVKEVPQSKCFSDVVNGNRQFFYYLLTNFTDREEINELKNLDEAAVIRSEFYDLLKNNTSFNEVLKKLSVEKKDSVSMDQLLNVAVKYFNIKGITPEGNYKAKVCGGLNGIEQTLAERKPHLEAFAFSTILEHLDSDENNMYQELVAGVKELYKVELGTSNEEKLLRAQGALYMIMRNNESLKNLLRSEYDKKKAFLPFVLIES